MIGVGRVAVWFRTDRMSRHAFKLVVDSDGRGVINEVHFFPNQFYRYAVKMLVQTDISVLVDGGDTPLLDLESDGIQRAHAGALDLLVLFPTAIVPTGHVRVVMNFQSDTNGGVKSFQVIVFLFLHQRIDGPVDQFHGTLHQGLVAGMADAGRKCSTAVVFGECREVLVQLGLILVWVRHRRFQIVRHDNLRCTAVKVEGVLAGVDKIILFLAQDGFHVCQLGTRQDSYENFH